MFTRWHDNIYGVCIVKSLEELGLLTTFVEHELAVVHENRMNNVYKFVLHDAGKKSSASTHERKVDDDNDEDQFDEFLQGMFPWCHLIDIALRMAPLYRQHYIQKEGNQLDKLCWNSIL